MAPYPAYNFGVEIETVVKPYALRKNFPDQQYYQQLAQKLQNRLISAVPDTGSKYSKHPEYYGRSWFITRDGSLKRAHTSFVPMEIVSPVMNTQGSPAATLSEFWEAINVGFTVQKEKSCGGHVHITPSNLSNRFSMADLRNIAFATIAYEDYVYSLLPATRKNNMYCYKNTQPTSKQNTELTRTCGRGLSTQILRVVAAALNRQLTEKNLYDYLQTSRYVVWNFAHIVSNSSGTVEFRGASQFFEKNTLRWVAFVVAFINLALTENLLQINSVVYTPPSSPFFNTQMNAWWERIRQSARQHNMARHLPRDWREMQTS